MKKNKLYTANKWNKPVFMPKGNMFPNGGAILAADRLASAQYGADYGDAGKTLNDYMNSTNALGISKADNPFSKMNLQGGLGAMASTPIGGALISGLSSAIGDMVGKAISGGLQSGAGNAISSIGGTIGGAVGQANPLAGAAIGVGSQLAGGLVNAAFGSKVDEAKLKAANEGTAAYNNFTSNASSFDDIEGPESQANVQNAYSGGLFSGRKARRKNRELKRQRAEARSWADRSITNNIDNLVSDQLNDALANYAAFGGPISSNKKYKTSDMIYPAFMNNFAIGGDLQTNGADFTSGLTRVDAGGSHETSPYDGVQMGVDSEGTPNLVEEGETIFDNYVFSNRILADESTKKLFHLPKKKDITFADISKKLEKEIAERPNDPISRAGFKAQMEQLEEQQERQKQEMEATRARAAFEALTPEEQTALMQQVAQQEAATEQQVIEAQQAQEQAATQQPSPEEMAIDEQQAMAEGQQEIPVEELLAQQQAQVAALGGRLVKAGDVTKEDTNMFATGGRKARKAAKRYNKDWFLAQAKSLGMTNADLEGWEYNPNDPEANLSTFNNRFRDFQKKRALETYRTGQKKSKENELFGDKRLYRYSDDKSKIFKTRINDADRIGWINADYTGALDDKGNLKGFISQEDYNKLSDKDKEAYKRINERAGDKMYDFRGKAIEDLYNGSIDDILGTYNYDEGFKWNDKDAQTLQYPVDMEKSDLSYLRYAPALGGAIGYLRDTLSSPDYRNAEAIINASKQLGTPAEIQPHYIGNYLTYRPLDIWFAQNRMDANARGTERAIVNSSAPVGTKMAGLLASGYNNQIANGQLFREAQEYNDALKEKVATFNRGTNQFNAQMDYQTQADNQQAKLYANRLGLQGLLAGYQMKDDIDARRGASMSANLTNMLQSIGNIGEEAYDEDRLKWLERTGILGSNVYDKDKYSAKEGGKLKRKKGLTY